MKDTSDLPDVTGQAKPTGAKPRAAPRSRENVTAGSQEQDTRSAPRRRAAPSQQGSSVAHSQGGGEKAVPSAPAPTRSSPAAPARPGPTGAGALPPRTGGPAPQRTSGPVHQPNQTQRGGRSPAAMPRTGGGTPQHPTSPQRNTAGPTTTYRQANTPPGQRTSGTSGPQTQPAPGQRSGHSTRSGSLTHGPTRSTGPTHGGPTRPTTPVQRTSERRAPVVKEKPTGPITIPPQIIVKDLADLLHATPTEVIRMLIKHSVFASINQVVDYDKAALVAKDLGFEPTQSALTVAPAVQGQSGERLSANQEMMALRDQQNTVIVPPVVTIMGHVDHGKTSLLDTIRKTKVAAGEAGGITQHIGAYQVEVGGKKITFLDTPGHEAFTAMRARGAQVTHIAIIVVAADDGVMPQTREAIAHAQAAKVPIIIAINKIDKENANPDYVKQQLADMGVVIEEYGGDTVCVEVSARRGIGIDELLEMILLVAEVQDIRANPNRPAVGTIIEARLDKSSGPMATVLVQQGTLKMGDNIVVGALAGKVRAMFNDRGKRVQKAPPSTPVSIIGLPEVPEAGDRLEVVADERTARQRATQEAEKRREETMPLGQVNLDTLYMQMQEGKVKELNVVLKCDVQGSAEAIKNALSKVGEDNLKVRLIHEGIGNISETDVHLAAASDAVIIGFNVKADGAAQRQAQKEGVEIRYYNVIYKLIDDIQAALTGMLEPVYREVVEGHAEVIQIFKAGKNIVIAGCRVTDGKIARSSRARVMRKGTKVFEGLIASLRRGKDDVREIASGYECGIVLEDFNEFEVGDIIEAFAQERVKPGA